MLRRVTYLRCKRILLKESTIDPTTFDEGPQAMTALTVTQPMPPALLLPHGSDQRRALETLVGDRNWAEQTWVDLIENLLALGRTDIPLARLAEGHIDALRILGQAHVPAQPGALYGVWASRSGQTGVPAMSCPDGSLALSGTLRFASGAGLLDRALVPVWLDKERHQLLDLDVRDLPVDASVWHSTAMAASRTYEVRIELTAGPETRIGGDRVLPAAAGLLPRRGRSGGLLGRRRGPRGGSAARAASPGRARPSRSGWAGSEPI